MYLRESRLFPPPDAMEPLVAAHPDGFFVTVKLCGENLHAPFNCEPTELVLPSSLVAAVTEPGSGMLKFMKVRFANPVDPYFEKEIEAMQNKGSGRVGLLGVHSLEDYVEAPHRTFQSCRGRWELIQLALYGPFQASDRKEFNHYELKTFIFSNEPGEWGFEIDQKRPDGRVQLADITDDTTGMPHAIARKNIAMYINETAGDPALQRTVIAWNHKETGQIYYYLDISNPLRRGQEIELLVSYDDHYDDIRERKGYGAAIKSGKVQSDDHFPTFLLRNFDERDKMHEIFQELDAPILLYELSDCMTRYWGRLVDVVNTFLSDLETPGSTPIEIPYAQQIVALRRLEWLSSLFLKTRERLQWQSHYPFLLQQCDANSNLMNWPWWSKLLSLIHDCNQKFLDARGVDLNVRLRNELIEEQCYALRNRLIRPFDEGSWCDVANDLVHYFCIEVVRHCGKGDSILFGSIAAKALEASKAISNIDINKLSFSSRAGKQLGVDILQGSEGSKFVVAITGGDGTTDMLVAIDTSAHSRIDIDVDWYRSEQILLLARIFRAEFAPNAPEKDLINLCIQMGVGLGVLKTSTPFYDFSNKAWKQVTPG